MKQDIFLALKVDVDTLRGHTEGVGRLLKIFGDRDIKATFLFSFGPDNSGKAIKRIFRPGFIQKMFRTKATSAYGFKTMLYGTLLPAPMIVGPNPAPFVAALEAEHDCGIHAWDHVKWQDELEKLSQHELKEDYLKAIEIFKKYAGKDPRSCGAPGWQVSEASLAMQDEFNFDYCSDTRGNGTCFGPFIPRFGGKIFKTVQIPSTMPTADEGDINEYYSISLFEGLNVHTIHAEMEGGILAAPFEKFIDKCLDDGVIFKTLLELAEEAKAAKEEIPVLDITIGTVPGRSGTLAKVGGSRA